MRLNIPYYTSRRAMLNRFIAGTGGLAGWKICGMRAAIARNAITQSDAATIPAAAILSAPELHKVAEVIGSDSIRLDGGAQLRLLGLETSEFQRTGGDPEMHRLAIAGRDALRGMLGGGSVALRYDAIRHDRYGRLLAHGFTGGDEWLQADMVRQGHVRVQGDVRNRYGLRPLLALESIARSAGLGIWQHRAFAVRSAADPGLERLAGRFAIISGKVIESAVTKGIGYVNFGAEHAGDLTLVLNRPALAQAEAEGLDVTQLPGKTVRCRGWLESFNGPRIEITHPEQIEVLED